MRSRLRRVVTAQSGFPLDRRSAHDGPKYGKDEGLAHLLVPLVPLIALSRFPASCPLVPLSIDIPGGIGKSSRSPSSRK